MTNTAAKSKEVSGWLLTYRKSGYTRKFPTLEAARRAQISAAARYGTRWLSLWPERE